MFSKEWEERFEELEDALYECQKNGGSIAEDMPEEWKEYCDMKLIYDTEFF